MRGAQSRTSAVEAGAIVTRPRPGCCAAVGMRYIDSAARRSDPGAGRAPCGPLARDRARIGHGTSYLPATGMAGAGQHAAISLRDLDLGDRRQRRHEIGRCRRVGVATWPDRGAEEDHRHALVVGILAAVRRDGRGHQPLLLRRDDDVAAAAGVVAERGGADDAVARLARRLRSRDRVPSRRRSMPFNRPQRGHRRFAQHLVLGEPVPRRLSQVDVRVGRRQHVRAGSERGLEHLCERRR